MAWHYWRQWSGTKQNWQKISKASIEHILHKDKKTTIGLMLSCIEYISTIKMVGHHEVSHHYYANPCWLKSKKFGCPISWFGIIREKLIKSYLNYNLTKRYLEAVRKSKKTWEQTFPNRSLEFHVFRVSNHVENRTLHSWKRRERWNEKWHNNLYRFQKKKVQMRNITALMFINQCSKT